MTYICLPTATTHVITNDFWLNNGIAGTFTVNLGNSSMVAQDLKQLYYVKMVGKGKGSSGVYLTSTLLMFFFDFCLMPWKLGFNLGAGPKHSPTKFLQRNLSALD